MLFHRHVWLLSVITLFVLYSADAVSPTGLSARSFALRRSVIDSAPSDLRSEADSWDAVTHSSLVPELPDHQTHELMAQASSKLSQDFTAQKDGHQLTGITGIVACIPVVIYFCLQFHDFLLSHKASVRKDCSSPEAVFWWLAPAMFFHAAFAQSTSDVGGILMARLHAWAPVETTAFLLMAGFQSSARVDTTLYVGALAFAFAFCICQQDGYSATFVGASPLVQLLWCLIAQPVLQRWSRALGRGGLLAGWFATLVGVIVQSALETESTQSLVWLLFASNLPAFFVGLALKEWRLHLQLEEQWLGCIFLSIVLAVLTCADPSHLCLAHIQEGPFSYTVSVRVAIWLVMPVLAAAVLALSYENDRLRRLLSPYLPFNSMPFAPWALLPSVGPLALGASPTLGPSLAFPLAASICFTFGCLLDGLVFFILEKWVNAPHGNFPGVNVLPTILEEADEVSPPAVPEPWPGQMWVHEMCLHSAEPGRVASRTALVTTEAGTATTLTYGRLQVQVEAAAASLLELSLGPGTPCGVVTERNFAMIVGLLAPMVARGFAVPIEPLWPKKRQDYCMNKLQVQVVIADNRPREVNDWNVLPVIFLNATDGGLVDRSPSLGLLRSLPEERVATSSPATIVWTSGSTGFPKAVAYSHDSVAHGITELAKLGPLTESSRTIIHSPFVWATLEWQLFCPLMLGGECFLAKVGGEKDPAYLAELVQETQTNFFSLTPPLLDKMLDHAEKLQKEWLEHVMAVGSALPMATVRRFHKLCPGISLHNLYGASETAMVAWTTTDEPTSIHAPVGWPQDHATVLIVNDKDEIVTDRGVKGQIVFAGILQSYGAGTPEESSRFRDFPPYGRVYMSGDVGCFGKFGLEIFGRMDNQVQVNGIRIEPAEIEVAAKESEVGVREAVCTIPDDGGAATIVLFVTPATVDEQAVMKGIKEQKPHYMVPNLIKAVDAMPMLPNGKFDAQELMRMAEKSISSSSVTIVDSLGQIRKVSQASAQLQRAVEVAYALGMIGTITSHWFGCRVDHCEDLQPAHLAVGYIVRNFAGADFLVLLFVVASALLDHTFSPRANLGQRELICLAIFWFIGWPLTTGIVTMFPPFHPCSLHRWYLMMYVVARVYLSCTRKYFTKAEQTLFLATPVLVVFLLHLRNPIIQSRFLYFCGYSEVCNGWWSLYDTKFAICTLLYVAAFNHGVPVAKFAGRWITPQQCCFLAPAYFAMTLVVHPNAAGILDTSKSGAECILELINVLVLCGLSLSAFLVFQPAVIRWLGQNALAAFIVHALIPVKPSPLRPILVFTRLAAIQNPAVAIPVQLLVALAYPVFAIIVGAAVFGMLRLLFAALRWAASLLSAGRPEDKQKSQV